MRSLLRVQVLREHWPDVPVHPDVRTLPRIGGIDVVCGGFPCQPFSHAGKQLGTEDDRHLWPALLEVIKRERPAWFLGENVVGIINLGLDQVLADLEANGYAWRTFVIPAVAVDAPHRRDRVWIVARDTNRDGEPDLRFDAEMARLSEAVRDASDADSSRLQGRDERPECPGEWPAGPGIRQLNWPSPDAWIHRVDDGLPARMDRLKSLGNAVVPQVVEVVGRAIMKASLNVPDDIRP